MKSMDENLETASFWFIPSNEIPWQQIIDELAEEFGTSKFRPHLTLHCVFERVNIAKLRHALQDAHCQIVSELPLKLKVSGIGHSSVRFKTLFLEFERNEQLEQLHENLMKSLESSYVFKPHLSLMYQEDLAASIRENLVQRFVDKVRGSEIEFGSIAAVSPGKGQRDFNQVNLWEIICQM